MRNIMRSVIAISLLVVTTVYGTDNRKPGNTEKFTACNCGQTTSGSCTYNTSSQNTLCDCGTQCCNGNGNNVSVTITPYSGGSCTGSSGDGCWNATAGTQTSGTGELKTADCAGG